MNPNKINDLKLLAKEGHCANSSIPTEKGDNDQSDNKNQNSDSISSSISPNDSSSALTIITNDYESSYQQPQQQQQPVPSSSNNNNNNNLKRYKTSKKRYLLLIIFITLSMSNAFHWIEYAIIEKVVHDYYQVSTFWINSTSVVYMISYIIGIIPASYILDRFGLKTCLIIGSFINAFGSWIKVFSIARNRFLVAMIGQSFTAVAQLFILNIPPMLAATWFPTNQVTHATTFGVFGNQVGIALGFLVPPHLMPQLNTKNDNDTSIHFADQQMDQIRNGFFILSWSLAIITSSILILIVLIFESRPKHPPSQAQAMIREMEKNKSKESFLMSIKQLIRNVNFDLLFLSYGLNTGVFYAFSTVLSQMITERMGSNYLVHAGNMGLTMTLSGIAGSVFCGFILGWSGKFKIITLTVYLFSLLGIAAFTTAMQHKTIELLYGTCAFLGFFMTGYLPIGFEFAAEVSFPQPEGTSAGLLNAAAQIFGIISTYGSSPMIKSFGPEWTNIAYLVVLFIGLIMTFLVKSDLKRLNVQVQVSESIE